jgi:hypothetical protein
MAEDPEWPVEPDAAPDARSGDYVNLGLPPPLPGLAPPLHYARPGTLKSGDRDFPVVAGFAIGFGLYLAVAGAWWMAVRAGGGLGTALWGLAGVPAAAVVLGLILQLSFGWRGVTRGVSTAFGLTILIGCFGIASICGHL